MDSFGKQLQNSVLAWGWAVWNVPLLAIVRPWVKELTPNQVQVLIKLRKLTKNHVGSMYMGALVQGADLAGALMLRAQEGPEPQNVTLIFKDIRGDFLKRAEGDTLFICKEGELIRHLLAEVARTRKRVGATLNIEAFCLEIDDQPVAKFQLTISLAPRK